MPKRKRKERHSLHAENWERHHDRDLGKFGPRGEEDLSEIGDPSIEANSILLAHSGQWAWVQHEAEELLCRIDERVVKRHSAALAAGDAARVEWEGGEPLLKGIAPRRTKLSRRLPNGREQVVAANIDTLVIVSTLFEPRFKAGVIDRYLIAADVGGVKPVVCLNKVDLGKDEPEAIQSYRELGLPVVRTSCVTGEGIEELRGHLKGTLSVMAGQSGVGKSSLINALDPEMDIDVQAVSRFNEKGRHTTRRARLHELSGGIRLIDTPGVRQLLVAGVSPEDIGLYFPEIEELATRCRFRDCRHVAEPACAVLEALERGVLSPMRYKSYLRIRESVTQDEPWR